MRYLAIFMCQRALHCCSQLLVLVVRVRELSLKTICTVEQLGAGGRPFAHRCSRAAHCELTEKPSHHFGWKKEKSQAGGKVCLNEGQEKRERGSNEVHENGVKRKYNYQGSCTRGWAARTLNQMSVTKTFREISLHEKGRRCCI